jgi:hypothetical protein
MTKPIIKIVNVTTNKEFKREMTDEEFAQYEADQAAEAARIVAEAAEEAARVAAQAKLTALGLTVEDLQALGL